MSVINVWCGAVTSSTATVVGKVAGDSVRLAIADNANMVSPSYFGPQTPSADGVVRLEASGMTGESRYHFALEVDGVLDADFRGQFLTHPVVGQPATFTIGMGTCAGAGTSDHPGTGNVLAPGRLSNHTIFDTIRQQALADNWLLLIHGGDIHYYDIGSGLHGISGHDVGTYRRSYDDVLLQPRQHALYRNVGTVYMYDDHDFGPDNSHSGSPGRDNAVQVYQERVPHYPRGAQSPTAPNYQSFEIGRVLFVLLDLRADRVTSGSGKTMLGPGQKSWLFDLLGSSSAAFLVLVSTVPWDRSTGDDSWAGYPEERVEIVEALANPGGGVSSWLPRMCVLTGDSHSLGISTSNPWGGFPELQYSPLDSTPLGVQVWRDVGSVAERNLFGTVEFEDDGDQIVVRGVGYDGIGSERMRYEFRSPQGPAVRHSVQPSLYVSSTNAYTTSVDSGTYRECAVVFEAPDSGRVVLHWSGAARNTYSGPGAIAYLGVEVREGPSAGVGNVVLPPADSRTVRTNLRDSQTVRAGTSYLLSDLTPGASYNARLLHRVSSQVGEFFQRHLMVEPSK